MREGCETPFFFSFFFNKSNGLLELHKMDYRSEGVEGVIKIQVSFYLIEMLGDEKVSM